MKRRSLKSVLTVFSSAIGLLLLSLCFMPAILDDDGPLTLRKIQDLFFSDQESNSTFELERAKTLARSPRSKQRSAKEKTSGRAGGPLTSAEQEAAERANSSSAGGSTKTAAGFSTRRSSLKINPHDNSERGRSERQSRKSSGSNKRAPSASKTNATGANTGANSSSQSNQSEDQSEDKEDKEDDEEDDDKPELGPTVTTQIAGKVMSHKTRKGLSSATVQCLVFHPLSDVVGAPSWVISVATTTGPDGVFSLSAELPERAGAGAVFALLFRGQGHRPVAGVPISNVTPGRAANVGVFWLGQQDVPLQGTIVPGHIAATASLRDTGGLNPLAWDLRVRNSILGLFPSYSPEQEQFKLNISSQEAAYNNQRWLSLMVNEQWLGSQLVNYKEVEVERAGKKQKELLGQINFILGPDSSLTGHVTSIHGGTLPGAVVTALTSSTEPTQMSITGINGDFRFAKPPATLQGYRVEHSDYLSKDFIHDPQTPRPQLVLDTRRPDIPISVSDSVTDEALRNLIVTLTGITVKGRVTPSQILTLSSVAGDYRLTAAFTISQIKLAREGYFDTTISTPDNQAEAALGIRMVPARVIHQTAREARARSGANNKPSHGNYWWDHFDSSLLAWSQNTWLEFEVDFGAELAAFDFELGVRNHRIIDHKYHFEVQVDLEGMESQRLSILASQTDTQSGRLSLPARKGLQTVRVTWRNDRYIPGQLDANIVVDWIKFHQRPLTAAEQSAGK
jgi:hypothetical protein